MTDGTKMLIGRLFGAGIVIWLVTTTMCIVVGAITHNSMILLAGFAGVAGTAGWVGIAYAVHVHLYK